MRGASPEDIYMLAHRADEINEVEDNIKYEISINVNETVKVKLTELGKDVYKTQYDEINKTFAYMGARSLRPRDLSSDEEGYFEFQLWDLMRIFGGFMYMGAPQVFESNLIYTYNPHQARWKE